MLSSSSDFLTLAQSKLDWLDARMRLLAGNIANSDTPGYRRHDLQPFSDLLARSPLSLARTDPADLSAPAEASVLAVETQGERAPDGNAVSIEHQMKLVADTNAQQELTTTLYKKYLGLMTTALGGAGTA